MRKPLLSLASVALVLAACGSSASSNGGAAAQPPAPGTSPAHVPATRPGRDVAYDGVTYQDPGTNPVTDTDRGPGLDVRDGRRHRLVHDRPALRRRRQHAGSGQRPDGGMGQRVRPGLSGHRTTPRSASTSTAPRRPFLASRDVLLRVGIQARAVVRAQAAGAALTFVIDTSGLDGPRATGSSWSRTRSACWSAASGAAIRSRSSRSATTPASSCRRPARPTTTGSWPPSTSSSRAARRTSRPASRSATSWPARPCSARRHRPGHPRLGRRRERRADRRRRHPRPDPSRCRGRHRAGLGRGRDGQLQRHPARAAGRPGRRLLRLRQRPVARPAACSPRTSSRRSRRSRSTPRSRSSSIPAVVATYRLIGYENRAVADRDFRDPRVDAGAIGAGHAVTALYDLSTSATGSPATRRSGRSGCAGRSPGRSHESALRSEIRAGDLAPRFAATDPTFRLDAIVAAAAEALRDGAAARTAGPARRSSTSPARTAACRPRPGPRLRAVPRADGRARRLSRRRSGRAVRSGRPPGRSHRQTGSPSVGSVRVGGPIRGAS